MSNRRCNRECANDDVLYIVTRVTVIPGLERAYIRFLRRLNRCLLSKFPRYYRGLQLYQNNENRNVFTVVESYNNIPSVYNAAREIREIVRNAYSRMWGCTVRRVTISSFLTSRRII